MPGGGMVRELNVHEMAHEPIHEDAQSHVLLENDVQDDVPIHEAAYGCEQEIKRDVYQEKGRTDDCHVHKLYDHREWLKEKKHNKFISFCDPFDK